MVRNIWRRMTLVAGGLLALGFLLAPPNIKVLAGSKCNQGNPCWAQGMSDNGQCGGGSGGCTCTNAEGTFPAGACGDIQDPAP